MLILIYLKKMKKKT